MRRPLIKTRAEGQGALSRFRARDPNVVLAIVNAMLRRNNSAIPMPRREPNGS